MTDLYEILGVAPDAELRAIKSAFRRKARTHHPDLNPDDARAKERFIEIAAAFEVLSDPERRDLYDEFGMASLQEDFDPERARWARDRRRSEQARQRPPTSSPASSDEDESWSARFKREFDLNDSSFRSTFERAFRDFNPFSEPQRGGARTRRDGHAARPQGKDLRADLEVGFFEAIRGGGVVFDHPDGGVLTVRLPPGVEDGEVLLVSGEGYPSPEGGPPGDLWLTVQIDVPEGVRREESDVVIDLPITMAEAVKGAKITVPTPHGDCVMTLPEGIHSGARLRLREMGVHEENGQKGDLYVIIAIRAPTYIDDAVREAAEAIERGYPEDVRAELARLSSPDKDA